MAYYENVFIARQDISASAVEGLAERFASVVKENGGEVTKKEHWGLRSLAYRIKKNRKGHYVLFNIDAPWSAVQEMERQMRINEDVLRFLTLRVDELETGPSVVMQSRASRDERGRRDGRDERGRRDGRDERGRRDGREERERRESKEERGEATDKSKRTAVEEKEGAGPSKETPEETKVGKATTEQEEPEGAES